MNWAADAAEPHSTWTKSRGDGRLLGRIQLDLGLRRKVLAHGGPMATQTRLLGAFTLSWCRGWLTLVSRILRHESHSSIVP